MITEHAYLDKYPLSPVAKTLILGTLHPANTDSFIVPFFYGNRCSLWRLFSRAYPEELPDPYHLPCILNFLLRHDIGISDVIRKGRRKRSNSGDSDLEVLEYNSTLRERILSGKVKTVVCTGGNHPKGVMGIFLQKIMNVKTSTHTMGANAGITLSLPGKELRVYRIPSPSGAANRGIAASKDYKVWKKRGHNDVGIDDYKIYILRRIFDPIILRKISP